MPYSKIWGAYIPDSTINHVIESWQAKQPERERAFATPSTLTECPRVIWARKQGIPFTNVTGWGQKQRFMLGRITENLIAQQLDDEGLLLHHWRDDTEGESEPLGMGEGLEKLVGTPDLLIRLGDKVAISDSKTSRSDSFNYVPILEKEIWNDPYWSKYKTQLTAYFMLCHANKDWFKKNKLPLPEVAHLFSYALDDGIVRRELSWEPSQDDCSIVRALVHRWNSAYASEEMPECTCVGEGTVKFCPYGIKETGKRVCSTCCNIS